MGSIITLLARPLIQAAVSAFGHVLLDMLKTWIADRNAQALGRAELERDMAVLAGEVEREMGETPEPELAELIRRLREGQA